MINRFQLLRNIGQFDSVDAGANTPLGHLALIYAENSRGKTTLSAVLRSLATGDPVPIAERQRLTAQHPPHIVIDCEGGPPAAIFQNGAWNRTLGSIAVFDDVFVDENVYSGLAVGPDHRQNLHELILGARGLALNEQLLQLTAQIERHNATLRAKAAAVPAAERGTLTVEDFCALVMRPDVDEEIQTTERDLAAVREQDTIRDASGFDAVNLPFLNVPTIERVLQQGLPALDAAAAARVHAHLAGAAQGAEAWVADGMRHLPPVGADATTGTCPFCAQALAGSPVIAHYRAFFGDAYRDLKSSVADMLAAVNCAHGGDVVAAFERSVRVIGERRRFWSRFCETPEVSIDTAAIARDWQAARDAVVGELSRKQAAPLESMALPEEARTALMAYEAHRLWVAAHNDQLQRTNAAIQRVKERAATGNSAELAADVARLKAIKARHAPATALLCDAYLAEKAAKLRTEQLREQAKAALGQYRATAFPGCQAAINLYLEKFNAGFRLDQVLAANTRGGPTCTYNVVINNASVPVTGGAPVPGQPSFRNTLSAGDRNALALAFFLTSLDQDPDLANKIVVIDDPVSSLDEHRALTTVQEVRRLALRTSQVIVLSHNKSFLCRIWEGADRTQRSALQVRRDGASSTIAGWDVDQDSVTEHDRRHALMRQYLEAGTLNSREVAEAIRPLLEGFLRVACPERFPPGTLLGPFRELCARCVGTPEEILDAHWTQELADLTEYANRFHHDTNPAWETEMINDGELSGFVQRALDFATR